MVQDAVREVLDAVYEQDFLNCSYGFRPGCSAHDAIRALDQEVRRGQVNWILEADIVSYFDSLDRTELKKLLQLRVADGPLLQLFRDKAPMRGARVLQRHVMTFGITAVAEGTQEEEDCQGSKKTRFVRVYRKDADDWKLVSNVQIVPETDPGALSTNP